jgi:cysteine desulfurase/selenocysteine lyase
VSVSTATATPFDVERVRQDFPILHKPLPNGKQLVYLDNGATSQKPQAVIDKLIECCDTYHANVHRGIHALGDRVTTEMEQARESVRRFINAAETDEIIFTSGTTSSVNAVAFGWARKFFKPGDEVLLNEMEHHANFVPWQQAAFATGATLKFIPLTADGRLDLTQLDSLLTSKTKLVAVTGMSNVLGTINPIDVLAARAKQVGALIFVDGAQSVPHGPVDVRAPAIDFLAFSGHKLYGPTGIGVLYGRRELLEAMDPFMTGGNMIRRVRKDRTDFADIPAKFEAGTPPIAEAIGLGTAIEYVERLGFPAIQAQEHRLTELAYAQLKTIPELRLVGPDVEHRGSILSFTVEGVHPHDMAELLDRHGVAVRAGHHCTMPLHELMGITATTRASFAFYNTAAEVEALVAAIFAARKVFRRG